ncbi:protein of unknown function [Clostridium beijerinckii]|nr:protein of unknown function [Clostridium beijerinckii]
MELIRLWESYRVVEDSLRKQFLPGPKCCNNSKNITRILAVIVNFEMCIVNCNIYVL